MIGRGVDVGSGSKLNKVTLFAHFQPLLTYWAFGSSGVLIIGEAQ